MPRGVRHRRVARCDSTVRREQLGSLGDVAAPTESIGDVGKPLTRQRAVLIIKHNGLSCIAATGHVAGSTFTRRVSVLYGPI